MSKTESAMVELGTVAPAFELADVMTGKAVGRDDVAAGTKGLLVMFICVHCPYVSMWRRSWRGSAGTIRDRSELRRSARTMWRSIRRMRRRR